MIEPETCKYQIQEGKYFKCSKKDETCLYNDKCGTYLPIEHCSIRWKADDDYTFEDHVKYKRDNLEVLSYNVKIPKELLDSFKTDNFRAYGVKEKLYKWLFPMRFEVNRKVKMYFIRKVMPIFVDKMDEFIAWGDSIGGTDL